MKANRIAHTGIVLLIALFCAAESHAEQVPDETCATFTFRGHRDNFVLVEKYSDKPNIKPFAPYLGLVPGVELTHDEVAFQLSFKTKFINNILGLPVDLWGGYTQQSYWQAYNGEASRPFRETNYQPEVMTNIQINQSLMGIKARFISLGIEHQSNGQLALFSRSWNRLYAELQLHAWHFTVTGRFWRRFGDMQENQDIYHYMGHGHITASFTWRRHVITGLLRYNLSTDYGALQVSYSFPLLRNIKGYIQGFSGYGQSLIDYNAYQKTIGAGFQVDY